MGLLGAGNKNTVEKFNAIRANSSILGIPIPILLGQQRIPARLIDYNDFTINKAKQQGGKGLGKGGTQYVYSASIIGLLAQGPIRFLLNLWDSTGRFVLLSTSEPVTVAPGGGGGTGGSGGGSGGYPPTRGGPPVFGVDIGVFSASAFSVGPFTDYGSPGPVTLTGTQNIPLTPVTSVTASDFFSGSSGLGANWTVLDGTFLETTGHVHAATVGGDSRAVANWNANTFGPTQLARCAIATTIGSGGGLGPAVRIQSGTTYYGFIHTSTQWVLFKNVAGTVTNLATGSRTPSLGDVLTLYVTGTTLTAYINGSSVTTQTDAAIATGQPGMAALSAYSTSNEISGWSAGDVLLTTGQYAVNPNTGLYYFSPQDAGTTVTVNYSYYRYEIITQERTVVPFTGPFTITVDNSSNYKTDQGVVYYPSGTAFIKVASSPGVGQYSQSGATYTFNAGDTGQPIVINYIYNDPNTDTNAPTTLNLTLVEGLLGQAPLSYMTGKHPSKALGYSQLAYIFSSGLYLGFTPELPNYSYELAGNFQFGGGIVDANPIDCIIALLTDTGFGVGFPTTFVGNWTLARSCWTANSFLISPVIENQSACAHLIGPWLEAGMVGGFWSEALLKLVPYGDTTAVGNGVTFSPPTTPVANITDDNYILTKDKTEDPVKISRSAWQDAFNRAQVSYQARVNDYNPEVVYEQDEASIGRFGLRIEDPKQYDFITTLPAAQYAASMRVQRTSYIRNEYTFRLPDTFSYLEPMDVVTINDLNLGLSSTPVRINKIEDDPMEGLSITAEDFIWGTAQPAYNPKNINSPYVLELGQQDPGNTNVIIFEGPNRFANFAGLTLYGFANGSNPNWGGCHVWTSFDGTNYELLATITTPGRLGVLTQSLASYSAANPDTTNTLQVKLNVAGDTLPATTSGAAAAGVTNCAIVNPSNALEILSYQNSALAGAELYNLTTLYRGTFGTTGSAHNPGEIFARLDEASFIQQYDPIYLGNTIFFKFTSFNRLGNQEQSLASVSAFSFVLAGVGKGAVALDTGFLLVGAPGYTVYRPLSNPLTGHDAGSNATVFIASFTMQLAGLPNISYNSGSVTGLSYNTLYYIYFDDPAEVGGTVTYQATTSKTTAITGTTRFFVGSITTPRAGDADTIGNNDGGNAGSLTTTIQTIFVGAYSAGVNYLIGNQVTFGGNYYQCISNTIGHDPTNTTYWQQVSTNSSVFLGAYNPATAYVPGNQVTFNGNYYICTVATTGHDPTNTSFWQQIGTSDQFLGAYNPATAYVPGNQVTFSGNFWICISATTGNAPSTTSSFWTLVGTSALFIGPWSSSTAYVVGNQVIYQNSYYTCILANTNQVPTNTTYWQLVGQLAVAVGFQAISNPDFQNGLTNYNPYDNNATGNVTISTVADTAAPGGFGTKMKIHVAGSGENPGLGGFRYALATDSGTVLLDTYHVGDTYVMSVWANIPSGFTLNFASNSLGTGGSFTPMSASYAGVGTWQNYIWQVVIGTAPSSNAIAFLYLTGTFTTAFDWFVAQLSLIDINQPPRGHQNIYMGAYSSTVPYVPGNEVSFNGNIWKCIAATIGNAPAIGSAFWQLVGTSYSGPNYNGAFTYTATTSSITWAWTGLVVFKADGTVVSVPNGTQACTGLAAGVTYLFYPYWSESLQSIEWASASAVANVQNLTGVDFSAGTGYMSTATSIAAAPTTYSVEFWFKSTGSTGGLVSLDSPQTGTVTTRFIDIELSGGTITIQHDLVAGTGTTPTYNDGLWHHVVLSTSANTGSLYIDGVLVISSFALGSPGAGACFWRVNRGASGFLTDTVSHVAIYSSALTAAQITAHFNAMTSAGMSAYETAVSNDSPTYFWHLLETAGTSATDSAGTNTGTYQGSFTLNQSSSLAPAIGSPAIAWTIDNAYAAQLQHTSSNIPLSGGGMPGATPSAGTGGGSGGGSGGGTGGGGKRVL